LEAARDPHPRCYDDDNLINGEICSHTLVIFTSKKLTMYEILQYLYIDDGGVLFGTRRDLEKKEWN
jgi:hypothetical protein